MAVLQALKGSNPGQLFPIERESVVLGRHPDCDIVLDIGAVSRQHARIVKSGNDFFIEDLHSRNGTYVNEDQIDARRALKENDQIRICDAVFLFLLAPPQPGAKPRSAAEPSPEDLFDDRPDNGSTIMTKLDVSSGREGLRLTVNAEAKLKALLEISQHLGRAVALDEVLQKTLDSLFAIFLQADRGYIILKDATSGRLIPRAVKRRRETDDDQLRISRTIIHGVMAGREAILSADASTDSRFDMSESIVDFHIHSMMCAPLVASDNNAMGVIQVDTTDPRRRFSPADLEVLASVACQAAIAVENAQLHELAVHEEAVRQELSLAHKVQQGFLPAAPPEMAGYEFFDFYEPAKTLGGDYFDYVALPDGRIAVVLGDVSGKGIAAALLMAKLSAEARYCLVSRPVPAEAIGQLNDVFSESRWDDRFITFAAAVLDPVRHEVAVINAGHLAPLVRRRDGTVEIVGDATAGLPLGVSSGWEYEQEIVRLSPGDCITLYTDGMTDALNSKEEFYGEQRLRDEVAKGPVGVRAMGQRLINDVRQFIGARAQADDMCVACFGRV
jgi:serine phosphatase RsbU (regulator of sigma subunit)